jgi:hypothetical protein
MKTRQRHGTHIQYASKCAHYILSGHGDDLRQQRTQLFILKRRQARQQKPHVLLCSLIGRTTCLKQLWREACIRVAQRLKRLTAATK